ncbi:hypothetical protein, partial [Christiangramia sp.]|uniref:hypothetical protein n=1 Tax=Christiangramia sp. TaxID=1931228 RepID=UPI00262601FC
MIALLHKFNRVTRFLLLLMFFALPTLMVGRTDTTTVANPYAYSQAGLANPTVASDKEDYAPGEIAIITGTGWTLDSKVNIHFEEEPSYDHHHGYHDTPVDANGNWRIEYAIEVRHIGVKFTVIVEGVQSKFQGFTYFTDANFEFSATGLPNGTPNSTLITVRYKINGGQEMLSQFDYNKGSNPRIPVSETQTITWTYDNIYLNGNTYSASGGTAFGNTNQGVQKITSNYSLSCNFPLITSHPTNSVITYGQDTSFSLSATGTVEAYKWQVSKNDGTSFTDVSNETFSGYDGATSATLLITKPTVAMNNYIYRIILSACDPMPTVTSNSATLTVNKKSASVVVADKTKEYGSADPVLTGTLDGFLAA